MSDRTITKSKIVREDFELGQGSSTQVRAGVSVATTAVDLSWVVTSLAELKALDTSTIKHATLDSGTAYRVYRYTETSSDTPDDVTYVAPNSGPGNWVDTKVVSPIGSDEIQNNSSIQGGVGTVSDALEINAGNIAHNAATLEQVDQQLTVFQDAITTNINNIAQNTTDIAQNTSDIAQNTTDIAQNTGDIAQHAIDIAQNAADIATISTEGIQRVANNTTQVVTSDTAVDLNIPSFTLKAGLRYILHAELYLGSTTVTSGIVTSATNPSSTDNERSWATVISAGTLNEVYTSAGDPFSASFTPAELVGTDMLLTIKGTFDCIGNTTMDLQVRRQTAAGSVTIYSVNVCLFETLQ